ACAPRSWTTPRETNERPDADQRLRGGLGAASRARARHAVRYGAGRRAGAPRSVRGLPGEVGGLGRDGGRLPDPARGGGAARRLRGPDPRAAEGGSGQG